MPAAERTPATRALATAHIAAWCDLRDTVRSPAGLVGARAAETGRERRRWLTGVNRPHRIRDVHEVLHVHSVDVEHAFALRPRLMLERDIERHRPNQDVPLREERAPKRSSDLAYIKPLISFAT
jgi:hypothetical protein